MAYEKRVAVLKQIGKGFSADGNALSGAVYAERLGNELTLKIQAAGLAAVTDGRYAVVFRAEKETFCCALGDGAPVRIQNAPSLKNGFSVLIAFVKEEVKPVAFGRCGAAAESAKELADFLNREETKRGGIPAIPVPPVEVPPLAPNIPRTPTVPVPGPVPKEVPDDEAPFRERAAAYDDEAIAEADYFRESVQAGNGYEASDGENEAETGKGSGGENLKEDDHADRPFLRTKGKLTYYKKVRASLEQAFKKFPKDTRLLSVFPRSEWVRTETALLGVVYEDGRPRYLCVATEKTGEPPEEMKEHCTFVPASPFSEEKGFYIVFQDADSGAYVNVSDA